jgi:hypothetical protein
VDEEEVPSGHWREDKVGLLLTRDSAVSASDPCPDIPQSCVDATRIAELACELSRAVKQAEDAGAFAAEPEGADEAQAPVRARKATRPPSSALQPFMGHLMSGSVSPEGTPPRCWGGRGPLSRLPLPNRASRPAGNRKVPSRSTCPSASTPVASSPPAPPSTGRRGRLCVPRLAAVRFRHAPVPLTSENYSPAVFSGIPARPRRAIPPRGTGVALPASVLARSPTPETRAPCVA